MKKRTIAIIGSGSLATIVGKNTVEKLSDNYKIVGILSRDLENALSLSEKLSCKAYKDIDELMLDKPNYVIEAASPKLVKDIGVLILESGSNFIPLSVGALADPVLYKEMEKAAIENNTRVHIPAGAVGGFDVLHSSNLMEDVKVEITSEKPPYSLEGAPYLEGKKLSTTKKENIFKGTAKEAIEAFPKNTNVTVATALATTGVNNTRVVINSNPNIKNNTHSIKLTGDSINVQVEIDASPCTPICR